MKKMGKIALLVMVLGALVLSTAGSVGAPPVPSTGKLLCTTDQRVYQQGVTVTLTCVNNGATFVYTGILFSVTTPGGDPVYTPIVSLIAIYIPPGGIVVDTWEQNVLYHDIIDGEFVEITEDQAAPGNYMIRKFNGNPVLITIE